MDEPEHLFNLPSVLRAVSASNHDYSVPVLNGPLGYSVNQIDTLFNALEPALRALVLAGYKPKYIELSNSTVTDSSRLFYDLEERQRVPIILNDEQVENIVSRMRKTCKCQPFGAYTYSTLVASPNVRLALCWSITI